MPRLKRLQAKGALDGLILLARPYLRAALWALLLALTGVLVQYPKHLTLEYNPVQSLRVFPNLPLFGGIYYAWLTTLVALAFLPRRLGGTLGTFEGLALAGVFSLTYRGMWDILLPDYGADGLSNIITAQFIMDGGTILSSNPNIAYLDFPGLHVLTVVLANIINFDIKIAVVIMLLVLDVLTAALLYLTSLALLKDVRLAVFAAVFGMLGNPVFAYYFFYPGYLGAALFFTFLVLLFKDQTSPLARGCALVLLAGVAISHFISSLAFAFALAGVVIADLYLRQRRRLAMTTVVFFAAVPMVWLVYGAHPTFRNLAVIAWKIVQNLTENTLFWFAMIARANLGGNQPLWARGVRFFWLFTLYGVGTLATLSYVARIRQAGTAVRVAAGAFGGLMLLSVTATAISSGGDQFFRFLVFAPVFTAPLLIRSLQQSPTGRRAVQGALVLATVAVSLPTLLVYRSPVEMYAYYPYEYYAGRFISLATIGEEPEVYSLALSRLPVLRYKRDAHYFDEGQVNVNLIDEAGLWKAVSGLEQQFHTVSTRGPLGLFLQSARPKVYYQHIFGIAPTSREWADLEQRLSAADLTYDSRHAKVYMWRLRWPH